MITTPVNTKTVPMMCKKERLSFKIILDKKIVAIGPILAMIAMLEDPISSIPLVIRKEGRTVPSTATPNPNKYTWYGNENILSHVRSYSVSVLQCTIRSWKYR